MEEKINQGFTKIPNPVILMGKSLTDEEFRLYAILSFHLFEKDYCFPGRKTLAVETGASLAKVDRVKKKLEDKGLIVKKRRGFRENNIYWPKTLFPEADESSVSRLNELPVTHQENKDNKTNKNYLDTQKTEAYKENKDASNSEPHTEPPSEVVFRKMVSRTFNYFLEDKTFLEENNLKRSELEIAKETLIYYVVKYKKVLGEDHPRYKRGQVERCYLGFVRQAQILRSYGWRLDFVYWVFREVINRWFSTEKDKNILRLNSYFGSGDDKIFFECLKYVGLNEEA